MSTTLKALHDFWLEQKPEGASHDESTCVLCTEIAAAESASLSGGSVAEKTYTQEEHDALLAQVEDLKTKVADLSKANEESELDSRIAAAKAELETQVADLQSKLDTAVLEASAAKEKLDETVAFLEGEKTAAEEAAALEARKADRVAQVKEVASFPDEYLESNADRFAAMSDEAFEAALEDWKTIAEKPAGSKAEKTEEIPAKTALTASRTTEGENVLAEVLSLRSSGVDVRSI